MRTLSRAVALASVVSLALTSCTVTPDLLSDEQLAAFGRERLDRVDRGQAPLSGPIDLYEAMARAIRYNLDARVAVMEAALSARELKLADHRLLPALVASSGYAGRSNTERGSVSTSDASVLSSDLALSWNILDFGLSYVRAKQAGDRVLIQEELKRKVVNATIGDVRTAYWRAVSYERLVKKMRALRARVETALADTRALAASGTSSPIAALTYERDLIQVEREVEGIESRLLSARTQLAALMNLPPDTAFDLVIPEGRAPDLAIPSDYRALCRTALANRPEMRELAYRLRINERELDAALLELLPGLRLQAGANLDTNDFLANGSWVNWGARASFNLMNAFAMPATRAKVEAEGTLLDTRSLSVAMAVMTQVHVGRAQYLQARKEFGTALELAEVQRKLLRQVRSETAADRSSQQLLIQEELNALSTEAKLDVAHADLQNAYANLYSALGIDPFPRDLRETDGLDRMAARLRATWTERAAAAQRVASQ